MNLEDLNLGDLSKTDKIIGTVFVGVAAISLATLASIYVTKECVKAQRSK